LKLFLIRHGKAGDRRKWDGPDDLRPLSKAGHRQADALVDLLRDEPLTRLVSSPSVRCRQTVEPLAAARRLPVDLSDALVEGSPLGEALRLVEKLSDEPTAFCSHGDVVADLLTHWERSGVPLEPELLFPKGSTWVLDVESGAIVAGHYLPPPGS
jgi:broad specificity phosphatase PhoE